MLSVSGGKRQLIVYAGRGRARLDFKVSVAEWKESIVADLQKQVGLLPS